MADIYRVKIKRKHSFHDVGRIVINRDGRGFCLIDMLPQTVLYVEKKGADSLVPDRTYPDATVDKNLHAPSADPEE